MENALLDCLASLPSKALKHVVRTVDRIASQDVPVLITGEGGVGKELVANLIHRSSGRPNPLANLSCASLAPDHLEQECRAVNGGTLFLRDLCEMPTRTQVKLLSLIETPYQNVAIKSAAAPACRIITATSHEPTQAVKEHKLYQALYYRLSGICLHLPPLRERREDILPLARAFLKRSVAQAKRPIDRFTPAAAKRLTSYDWPGNLNDLEREVLRAVLLSNGEAVDAVDLSLPLVTPSVRRPEDTSFTSLKDIERQAILQALKDAGGNKAEAAKRLGIGRQTLYNKIKVYHIVV